MDIRICETKEQLTQLVQLANIIWHEYFINIISEKQINYMVDKFQSYNAIDKAIQEEGYVYFLGYEDDVLIGYCGVKPEGDRLFLSKLYLHKEKRGLHLSSVLLQYAIAYARKEKKSALYLTCNKYNQHSLDIYYAKGFQQIDEVETDIGNGFIMDDYVLQFAL